MVGMKQFAISCPIIYADEILVVLDIPRNKTKIINVLMGIKIVLNQTWDLLLGCIA